jgi:hypothetical protein
MGIQNTWVSFWTIRLQAGLAVGLNLIATAVAAVLAWWIAFTKSTFYFTNPMKPAQ